jgi:hypothetical protein
MENISSSELLTIVAPLLANDRTCCVFLGMSTRPSAPTAGEEVDGRRAARRTRGGRGGRTWLALAGEQVGGGCDGAND